ncbi:MAG: hypothetical protein H6832_09240 [Planctomycetes bacterium]|nr:hypothetical protein [Planctomycetota bacterium]
MKEQADSTKIGAGHASAMARQGLRELRGALYPESNVAQQPEYGLYGTRTPGEVAESRRGEDHEQGKQLDRDEEPSSLQAALEQAQSREEPAREAPELERD